METNKIILPQQFSDLLCKLPESGMGYQHVNVFLKDGTILKKHIVLNSTLLVLEKDEHVNSKDIVRIELIN